MTVIHINKMYPPEIGGVEVVAGMIAKIAKESGFESKVLTFNTSKDLKIDYVEDIEVWRIPTHFRMDPVRISFEYRKYFNKITKNADKIIFHFPSFQPEIDFLFHRKLKDKTKICFFHAEVSGRGIIGHFYNRVISDKFLKKMEKIIVTSPRMLENHDVLKKYKDKIEVVPLFVDTTHFYYREHNRKNEILDRLGISKQNAKIVLYVGRFGRYKGLEYLVEAFRTLPANYVLVMIGRGPRKPLIQELVKKLKLENRVLFLENVSHDDLPGFYSAADVFVLPSIDKGEAFGIVVLEAMACGVPVITTELGTGTTYHNINMQTGLHVMPKDSKALANAIKTIAEENWKEKRKERIMQRAKEFDLSIFKQRIGNLLRE